MEMASAVGIQAPLAAQTPYSQPLFPHSSADMAAFMDNAAARMSSGDNP